MGRWGTTISDVWDEGSRHSRERFAYSEKDLLNNGDLFSLTQPKMICDIHRRFLEAGADNLETNTFGATSITQSEFFVDDPRETGGRKDPGPQFYQKIIEDAKLNELAWISTSRRRSSAASGRTGLGMRRVGSGLWPGRSGR